MFVNNVRCKDISPSYTEFYLATIFMFIRSVHKVYAMVNIHKELIYMAMFNAAQRTNNNRLTTFDWRTQANYLQKKSYIFLLLSVLGFPAE